MIQSITVVLLSLVASHHDLDLTVLERLQSDVQAVGRELVAATHAVTGAVVLATCNRFELYLDVDDTAHTPRARRAVAQAVADRSGFSPDDVAQHLRPLVGPEAGAHLFAVASGLESMVVGEREIAGQVRRALTTARRDGTTTSTLEALFQAASRTSRAVEKATGLGSTGRSVVGVALDLAARTLPQRTGGVGGGAGPDDAGGDGTDWAGVRCVLVGTGSYAGASLAALRSRGVQDVRVYSASGRAAPFAAARGATALPAGADLLAEVADVDLVVACSGAAGSVLGVEALAAVRHDEARPLTVVDLALRHDVDPDVRSLPGVSLVSLQSVAEHAPAEHAALGQAREIVTRAAAEFEADRRVREWDPAVVAERTRVLGALEAALSRLPAGEATEQRARTLRRRTRALLHGPTVAARAAARDGDAAGYARALADLAAVEVPEVVVPTA